MTIGRFPDGRLGEVFVANHKRGNAADVVVRDAGILISLLLQHGCAAETITGAVSRNSDGSPTGVIGAVLDLIAGERGPWLPRPAGSRRFSAPSCSTTNLRAAPGVFMFAVPNGGWRNRHRGRHHEGAPAPLPGVPDTIWIKDGRAYSLELKARRRQADRGPKGMC